MALAFSGASASAPPLFRAAVEWKTRGRPDDPRSRRARLWRFAPFFALPAAGPPALPSRARDSRMPARAHSAACNKCPQARASKSSSRGRFRMPRCSPFDLHLPLFSIPMALQSFAPIPPIAPACCSRGFQRSAPSGANDSVPAKVCASASPGRATPCRMKIAVARFRPREFAPILNVPRRGIGEPASRTPRPAAPRSLTAIGRPRFHCGYCQFRRLRGLDRRVGPGHHRGHRHGDLAVHAGTASTWVLVPLMPYWPYGLDWAARRRRGIRPCACSAKPRRTTGMTVSRSRWSASPPPCETRFNPLPNTIAANKAAAGAAIN